MLHFIYVDRKVNVMIAPPVCRGSEAYKHKPKVGDSPLFF